MLTILMTGGTGDCFDDVSFSAARQSHTRLSPCCFRCPVHVECQSHSTPPFSTLHLTMSAVDNVEKPAGSAPGSKSFKT